MRQRGLASVFAHLKPGGPVYVSIDIDVLDMPLVPGCGSSETGGLEVHELQGALSYLAETHEVLGFDLVEVNPLLDVPARNTSYLASQIITQFMSRIVEHPAWQARHGVKPDKPAAKSKPKSKPKAAGRIV
jgi:agmatinase